MKALILFVGMLFGSITNSQNITFKDGLYYEKDALYSGKYTLYFESGAVKEELTINQGKLNGEIVEYFENGTKKKLASMKTI